MDERTQNERLSPWVIVGRVVFTLALAGCIWFIFSNSMAVATVSSGSSGRVLAWMRIILRRLGQPGLARLADGILASFFEEKTNTCLHNRTN